MNSSNSNWLHNLFAGSTNSGGNSTNADYVINLNLPDWKSPSQPQQPVKTPIDWNPILILGGLTLLFVFGAMILKSRKA